MRKFALGLVTIAATIAPATSMSAAQSMGAAKSYPWCLVIQDQDDGWACGFQTFEQCRVEARAGNTGFCAANPAYQAPPKPARSSKRRQAR
ncbi:MAG TPA: DUF3551 domain-containing protein [Xanthobacteraceae bacterium]|jgi:ABC-type sugar transport system substrate-binding protein|nr:DUF3551 domain-containing protein [Xanthobacteraceae bacterium]